MLTYVQDSPKNRPARQTVWKYKAEILDDRSLSPSFSIGKSVATPITVPAPVVIPLPVEEEVEEEEEMGEDEDEDI